MIHVAGTMLYVVLGTVKEVSIGPTSLMALFTLQLCRGLPLEFVVLLTFLSGCVVLCMGLLRLGECPTSYGNAYAALLQLFHACCHKMTRIDP